MIVSINWLKKFTDIDMPVDELAILIGERLVEIESITDLGVKYKGVLVARVVECEKHSDSDHLNITKLDDGGVAKDVERDEDGYVQVVCGAPNIREDILVAWLPPGVTVPESFGDKEPFVLDARKLRGVLSNGMIASARELALYDEHVGILELDKDIRPGMSFAEAYELNDYLLDIENKSLTHRPDAFGMIGFAREVSAIQGKAFKTPGWLANEEPNFLVKEGTVETPTVTIDDVSLSERYQAIVLSHADGAAVSPLQIRSYLARVGVRPVSAVVDVTNYLMMLTGQPLHAFDYDKLIQLSGGRADIHVRTGRKNETLKLLDGRTITLTEGDIVIAAGEQAIGLAGAMGGANTEIDQDTKNIIVESATFNLYNLRATQMRHGIFSEAITRFTKGQPAALTAPVLAKAVSFMNEVAGAIVVSDVAESYSGKQMSAAVTVAQQKINAILGTKLTIERIANILRNAEFEVLIANDKLTVTPPYWRSDIHIDEDIVEEVGRLSGFDDIELSLPMRDFTAVRQNQFDKVRDTIRHVLVRAGANEVLTYSFVHGDVLAKAGQKTEDSYRIINSISPDLQYFRQTLTPSLLGTIHGNVKQGFDNFAVFEINKAHPKQHGMTDENVPAEADMVALTVTDKKGSGAPYYQAKKILTYVGISLGLDLLYSPIETDPHYPVTSPFDHRRSALVTDKKTDTFIGIVGEYKKSVVRGFKLPAYTAGFEIGSTALLVAIQRLTSNYEPVSRYPSAERDICFQVANNVRYQQVIDSVEDVLQVTDLETFISPVDIYQQESRKETKNITVRIKLTAHDHTLASNEVASIVDRVVANVRKTTKATII